ncbi:MAG: peptidylprolyl isomerase [Myxococcota bacterium]
MPRIRCPHSRSARAGVAGLALAACALAALVVAGCRAPRDPDLEQRVAAASAAAPTESPAPGTPAGAQQAPPPKTAAAPVIPKPADEVLRTLSDEDLKSILGAVGGEGPVLSATLHTERGDIRCTLDAEAAPQAVGNFVALAAALRPWRDPDTAELMKTPFFDGLTFHRIITGYIAQTGNPGVGGGGPGWRIPREVGIVDAFDQEGVMAMVDAGDDTHGSQFFITLRPSKSLAGRYTPFGRCGNLDVVRAIADADKLPAEGGKTPTKPVDPVRITTVEVKRQPAE